MFLILLIGFGGLFYFKLSANEEPEEVVPVATSKIESGVERPFIHTMSGISTKNRDSLIEYLKCRELLYGTIEGEPKLEITLTDWTADYSDSVFVSYETYKDIPEESVRVDCPKSSSYSIGECWFIRYDDDFIKGRDEKDN